MFSLNLNQRFENSQDWMCHLELLHEKRLMIAENWMVWRIEFQISKLISILTSLITLSPKTALKHFIILPSNGEALSCPLAAAQEKFLHISLPLNMFATFLLFRKLFCFLVVVFNCFLGFASFQMVHTCFSISKANEIIFYGSLCRNLNAFFNFLCVLIAHVKDRKTTKCVYPFLDLYVSKHLQSP